MGLGVKLPDHIHDCRSELETICHHGQIGQNHQNVQKACKFGFGPNCQIFTKWSRSSKLPKSLQNHQDFFVG